MSNSDPIRWKQRLQQFTKAENRLSEALSNGYEVLSRLEQEGVIQRFEYTFELAWKTLKDLLFYEGFDVKSPRDVIRQAFESEYLKSWFAICPRKLSEPIGAAGPTRRQRTRHSPTAS